MEEAIILAVSHYLLVDNAALLEIKLLHKIVAIVARFEVVREKVDGKTMFP